MPREPGGHPKVALFSLQEAPDRPTATKTDWDIFWSWPGDAQSVRAVFQQVHDFHDRRRERSKCQGGSTRRPRLRTTPSLEPKDEKAERRVHARSEGRPNEGVTQIPRLYEPPEAIGGGEEQNEREKSQSQGVLRLLCHPISVADRRSERGDPAWVVEGTGEFSTAEDDARGTTGISGTSSHRHSSSKSPGMRIKCWRVSL